MDSIVKPALLHEHEIVDSAHTNNAHMRNRSQEGRRGASRDAKKRKVIK
ncbi:hypothetical protein SBDP1_1070011 [Syntrophobacter sp. SbD1]|nr:hypothetical protein SBDP1_1070011 [Syntrophobacter sp. SbD1]